MSKPTINELLENLNNGEVSQIESFIDLIKNRYKVNLNFHDLAGVSTLDSKCENAFLPYLYHNNSFCNYVKKSEKGLLKCVSHKDALCKFCLKKPVPFYGRCYMGVEEFVFPVVYEKKIIALICVGQFYRDRNKTLSKIYNESLKIGLNPREAQEKIMNLAKEADLPVPELYHDIQMLCFCISMLFGTYINKGNFNPTIDEPAKKTMEDYKGNFIIKNTVNFIKENYNKELSLKVLALNSYCNPTYLSHIFKEKIGISVVDYIQKIRIDTARHLLDITGKSVTEICGAVGFNDSGYFCKVFKQYIGVSPSEYRNRK